MDHVGVARYVTKLDLLKGYWHVPLTERAKEISAFFTPDDFLQYTVMFYVFRFLGICSLQFFSVALVHFSDQN